MPLSFTDLVAWYGAHSPANLGGTHFADGTLSSYGVLEWAVHASSPAYSTPEIAVSYVRRGPHRTLIRTDAIITSHFDRTPETFVPASVTRIEVEKARLGDPRSHLGSASSSDPAVLQRVRAAYNALEGSEVGERMPCASPTSGEYVYTVTFSWPGHTLKVDAGQSLCGVGRGLTFDGTKLTPELQDSDALDAALQAAL